MDGIRPITVLLPMLDTQHRKSPETGCTPVISVFKLAKSAFILDSATIVMTTHRDDTANYFIPVELVTSRLKKKSDIKSV